MIATRFRSVGLVSCVAVAAIGCYMVSLRVASERAQLGKLESRIVAARQDIRALQTEMGTRARLSQLERWNVEVLALSSPRSGQYLKGEVQLASLIEPPMPVAPIQIETPAGPKVVQVAYTPEKDAEREAAPMPAMLRQATYIKPAPTERAPIRRASLLDDKVLGEIGRAAKAEAARSDTQ
jgi:hypothetical protein